MRRATATANFSLVGISQSATTVGCGDPHRKLSIPTDDFQTRTWYNDTTRETTQTRSITVPDVPAGSWEPVLILKVNRLGFGCVINVRGKRTHEDLVVSSSDFGDGGFLQERMNGLEIEGRAEANTKSGHGQDRPVHSDKQDNSDDDFNVKPLHFVKHHYFAQADNDANQQQQKNRHEECPGTKLLSQNMGKWFLLSLGKLLLPHTMNVCIEIHKWPPVSPGIMAKHFVFRGLELRAAGISWEKLRLLLLCQMGKAAPTITSSDDAHGNGNHHCEEKEDDQICLLQTLPLELLQYIISMIGTYTPLPRRAIRSSNFDAWKERRRHRQYRLEDA